MSLHNTNVLLGISGGIAAYKTPDLVRKLVAAGANVRVVLTESGSHFVSDLSLQAVSGNPVSKELLDPAAEAAMGHIELAKWADLVLIAPATANTIAKMAHGLADDLLTTLVLATDAPLFIAPAMNQQMWAAAATQENLAILDQRGVTQLGPASGEQACGDVGLGRMLEPMELVDALQQRGAGLLSERTVVITAGPTQEAIDPVRYISNHSSGKMGYAMASAAAAQGANVILVSGPVNLPTPPGVTRVNVSSAQQMLEAVENALSDSDIFIATAAVADYRVADVAPNKIKKTADQDELTLTFIKNPDILKTVAQKTSAPFTVGFAAESQNVHEYAMQKLKAKGLDMIAANDISQPGLGFNSDNNALDVFWHDGHVALPAQSKQQLASALIELIAQRYNKKNN